jgi:hypothetical protein
VGAAESPLTDDGSLSDQRPYQLPNLAAVAERLEERAAMRRMTKIPRAAYLLPFAFCLLPFAFKASAHEPITTKVRFNKEVVRIFARSCLSCHRPGGIAFFSLATYEDARPWAKAIKEEMLEKRMPVWHAVKGFGSFRNAPRLTQREMDLIVNWVEGGAPKGEDKDYPATPVYSDDWMAGKPDAVLPIKEQKVAADADEVRHLLLPTNFKASRWLRAIELRPGNGAVVLSASIYLEGRGARVGSRESVSRSQKSGVRSQKTETDSGLQTPDSRLLLATWMPGQRALDLPEDVGRLLPAGARLVVRIHYRGNGGEAKDRSAIGLYFARTAPPKLLREIAISKPDALIAVSEQPQVLKSAVTLTDAGEAIAIRPFAGPLLISFQASAFLPDGSEQVLLWSRGSRYDWQPTYYFNQPVRFPKGTRIEVTAYFDNSDNNANNPNDPARPLRWSEIASEPLCSLSLAGPSTTGQQRAAR